jgi:UDP-glucose 4-epimerase
MKILVTGGAGYIGSVVVYKLIEAGHEVNVIDDLSNGYIENVDKRANFIQGSILDDNNLKAALDGVDAVTHLAAKIRVEEGQSNPELYKKVNIEGTLNLIKNCASKKINKFVFASTATVYGSPEMVPLTEESKTAPINVYGSTKLEIDNYLESNSKSLGISSISLRFFNVGGALKTNHGKWLRFKHEGATHLIPNILKSSAVKPMPIFGQDWPTKDGTQIRDYVHVSDLADALLNSLAKLDEPGNQIINIGTSTGSTVLEVLAAAESVLNKKIYFKFESRRPGDCFALVTSNSKALKIIGWEPKKTIGDILFDAQQELISNS